MVSEQRLLGGTIDRVSVNNGSLAIEPTADGSITFRSERFGEAFHSRQGAWQEAQSKFVEPTHLRPIATDRPIVRVLDVCYGLGYNTAAALTTIWAANPHCAIEWVGLELDPVPAQAALDYLLAAMRSAGQALALDRSTITAIEGILTALATTGVARSPANGAVTGQFTGHLHWGDARQTLPPIVAAGFRADAIFLDPFSPHRCPQLWTAEFLGLLGRCLAPTGRVATYSKIGRAHV